MGVEFMKKSTSICLKIIEIILFVFAAIFFFKGFSYFSSDLQDFSHQWRLLPIEISYTLPVYWLFLVHLLIYPESQSKLHQTLFINGIVLSTMALIGLIVTSIYLGVGVFTFGDKIFSSIFPIEIFVLYSLSLLFGLYLILLDKKPNLLECNEFYPYEGKRIHKVFASIFRPFITLITLYFFGALLDGLFMGYLNSSSINYCFIYILIIYCPLSLLYYELIVRNKGEINISFSKKTNIVIASIHLGAVSILSVLAYSFLVVNPYYVIENFQMWLPLDFMGSLELFIHLITLPSLGYAIYFLIKAIKAR